MNNEKEKQEKKGHLASWVALLTAIAAILGAIGFNQFFPDVVKRYIFGATPQPNPSVAPSISTSSSLPLSTPSPSQPPLTSTSPVVSTSSSTPSPVKRDDKINEIINGTTLQTELDGVVTWELKSCIREQTKVSCIFLLSSSEDAGYGILGTTRMVDSDGTPYPPSLIQIGTESGSNGNRVGNNMVRGARYKTIIEFSDVPNLVSQVVLLQVLPSSGYYSGVKFRNVPIVSIE
jgi:hypothetical protein